MTKKTRGGSLAAVHAAIIHGIGVTQEGYSRPLANGITRTFDRQLKALLDTQDDFTGEIVFHEVLWDDVVAENQSRLATILRKSFGLAPETGKQGLLRRILTCPKRKINWLRTDFAAKFVEDFLSYRNPDAYRRIQKKVLDSIDAIAPSVEGKKTISLIAHSLGTVIASDFVWDRQKQQGHLHSRWTLGNLFTMGSPLALFVLQYGLELFKNPIKLEDSDGRWVNIYDRDDLIAYPLKPLNQSYDRVVLKDQPVDTGIFGVAHTGYWTHKETQRIIACKLVLDWLRLNKKMDESRLAVLSKEYDRTLEV